MQQWNESEGDTSFAIVKKKDISSASQLANTNQSQTVINFGKTAAAAVFIQAAKMKIHSSKLLDTLEFHY